MKKKPAKAAGPAKDATAEEPPKRSRLKLALAALVPLVLGGGGYGAWMLYLAPGEAVAGPAEGAGGHGEAHSGAQLPDEIRAESSFTHAHALATLMAPTCGRLLRPVLREAAEQEARTDGPLVNLSWEAAARRAAGFTEFSCGMVRTEIVAAVMKAERLAEASAKAEKPSAH